MTDGLRWSPEQLSAYEQRRKGTPEPLLDTSRECTQIRLVLPMPPSVNYAISKGYGRKSEYHTAFVSRVKQIVADHDSPHISGRLAVHVEIVPPDNRKRDIDNVGKHLLDALQDAGLFEDDSQVDDYRVTRMPVVIPGESSVVVSVRRIV